MSRQRLYILAALVVFFAVLWQVLNMAAARKAR